MTNWRDVKIVPGLGDGNGLIALPVLSWYAEMHVNPDFVRHAPQHFEDELKAAAPPSALRQTVEITRILVRPAIHDDAIYMVAFGHAAQDRCELPRQAVED